MSNKLLPKIVGANFWRGIEAVFCIIALIYFLLYGRDTLSDCIVLSFLCLLIAVFRKKLGLKSVVVKPISIADYVLVFFTLSILAIGWIYAVLDENVSWDTFFHFCGIALTYVYYAFIQHYLAQKYLAIRLYDFSEKHNILGKPLVVAAIFTGAIFGLLHIVYPSLILPTAIGGTGFALYYLSTGRFWAVIGAHAIISSSLLYLIKGENPFTELISLFS